MVYVDYYENILIIALIIGIIFITFIYIIYVSPVYEGAKFNWKKPKTWNKALTIAREGIHQPIKKLCYTPPCKNSIKESVVLRDYTINTDVSKNYISREDVSNGYILVSKLNQTYIEKAKYNAINDPIQTIKRVIDKRKNDILFFKGTEAKPVNMNIASVPTITTDTNGTKISFNEYYVTFDEIPTCYKTKNNGRFVLRRSDNKRHFFGNTNNKLNCNFGFFLDKGPYRMIRKRYF